MDLEQFKCRKIHCKGSEHYLTTEIYIYPTQFFPKKCKVYHSGESTSQECQKHNYTTIIPLNARIIFILLSFSQKVLAQRFN